jgi:hypothetical protein
MQLAYHIQLHDRCGSGAEVPPWSRERPLSEVKRTKSVRKRTSKLEGPLPAHTAATPNAVSRRTERRGRASRPEGHQVRDKPEMRISPALNRGDGVYFVSEAATVYYML